MRSCSICIIGDISGDCSTFSFSLIIHRGSMFDKLLKSDDKLVDFNNCSIHPITAYPS